MKSLRGFCSVVGTALVVITAVTGCSSGGRGGPGSSSSPESATTPAPSADTSESGLSAVAHFVRAISLLQSQYVTTAAAYKAAVEGKDTTSAAADASKLGEICSSEGQVSPSGDATVDAEWPKFAAQCAAGWADIAAAFRTGDTSLIAKGHAELAEGSAHALTASQRLIALGQKAMAQ